MGWLCTGDADWRRGEPFHQLVSRLLQGLKGFSMCGIVAAAADKNIVPVLVEGLKKLISTLPLIRKEVFGEDVEQLHG